MSFLRLLGRLDDRFVHGLPLDRNHVGPIVVRATATATMLKYHHISP